LSPPAAHELLPVFTGVRVEIEGDQVDLLATDRYRMALKELHWNPVSTQASGAALVPAKVLADAARSMTSGESVTLSISTASTGEGLIGLEGDGAGGSRQSTTGLLDGEFPKVRHLMSVNPALDGTDEHRRPARLRQARRPGRRAQHEPADAHRGRRDHPRSRNGRPGAGVGGHRGCR